MALNLKGKKTSLDEKAFIYEKRDEEESEKSKWNKMNRQQKITHFTTYYLRTVLIGILVLCIVGFFIYKDVIMKKDIIYHCAIINESAFDIPIDEFGEEYVEYLGLDPGRNLSSFHLFYTNAELANEVGATSTSDVMQISSMIYANTLDSVIAAQEDYDPYAEKEFFMDLTEILDERELNILKERLYIPDFPWNEEQHPYGVYLDQSAVYQKIFETGGGIVEKPIFGMLVNSERKEESRQLLYYLFPELKN